MKTHTLNIFILLAVCGLFLMPPKMQAGIGDPIKFNLTIMKEIQKLMPETNSKILESHIDLLMYNLAEGNNVGNNTRLDKKLSPPCTKRLNHLMSLIAPNFTIDTLIKDKVESKMDNNEFEDMNVLLDFAEGCHDYIRLTQGEYSEQQLINNYNAGHANRFYKWNWRAYAAGINTTAQLLYKKIFPWTDRKYYAL